MGANSVEKKKLFETTDFDNAICLTGYGKFHLELVMVCAISIVTTGFQNGLSSYVFPAAQCELELSTSQLGLLNVAFLVGGTLSSFLWGVLADVTGRKKVLIVTHLLNALVTVVCSLLPHTFSLVICRFLNGFLIGAPGSIIFSYLAEFQPPKYRTTAICYCGLFFTASWLILPVMAFLVLPLNISFTLNPFFSLTPWRLFLILLALPELVVALWFVRLPESPKYFEAKGDHKRALEVLKIMYTKNTGKDPNGFPVKNLVGDVLGECHLSEGGLCQGKTARVLGKVLGQIKSLFCPPLVYLTVLTCGIMYANMFGIFGLGLWLPELFIRFEQFQTLYPNSSVTVKELSSLSQVSNQTCEPSFDSSVIQSTVAMALTSLAFNAICGYLSSRVQLRFIPLASMLLGGLSAGSIYWMSSSFQNLLVSCVFQATMVTANMTIGSVVVELFPTKVGGIAICVVMCAGRIGAMCSSMVFGYLVDQHCEIPIFVVAVVVLMGAGICFLIPSKSSKSCETANKIPNGDYLGGSQIEIAVISNRNK